MMEQPHPLCRFLRLPPGAIGSRYVLCLHFLLAAPVAIASVCWTSSAHKSCSWLTGLSGIICSILA